MLKACVFVFFLDVLLVETLVSQTTIQDIRRLAPIRPPLEKDSVEKTLEANARALLGQLHHSSSRQELDANRPELRKRVVVQFEIGC